MVGFVQIVSHKQSLRKLGEHMRRTWIFIMYWVNLQKKLHSLLTYVDQKGNASY